MAPLHSALGDSEDYVFSFFSTDLNKHLGNSKQVRYLISYISGDPLNAKTCVLEKKYIDKDFMLDYQNFYSRSFRDDGKFTKRLHFFNVEFSQEEFKKSLEDNDLSYLNEETYLGFVVIRPIKDIHDEPLIGRTLLKVYLTDIDGEKRVFVTRSYKVSLFGIELKMRSLPFQAQDQGVGGCATMALYSALHPLAITFGLQRSSPSEITEMSTSFPIASHKFPSSGLTWGEMINCVRSIGLEVETIGFKSEEEIKIKTAVMAYIDAGFPLIAALDLIEKTDGVENYVKGALKKGAPLIAALDRIRISPIQPLDRHAVVISGYRSDFNNNLRELYVHDDQICPYNKVTFDGSLREWRNEWNSGYYVILEKLLAPIYPKIRLPFIRMNRCYEDLKAKIIKSGGPYYDLRLCLVTIKRYKKFLLKKTFFGFKEDDQERPATYYNKDEILTLSLPRFMWIVRAYENDKLVYDLIYDGISVYPHECFAIVFT